MQFPDPIPYWLHTDRIEIKDAIGKLPNIKPRKTWEALTLANIGISGLPKEEVKLIFAHAAPGAERGQKTDAKGVAALLRLYEAGLLELKGKPGRAEDIEMFIALQPYREAVAAAQAKDRAELEARWRRALADPETPGILRPEDLDQDRLLAVFRERFGRYDKETRVIRLSGCDVRREYDEWGASLEDRDENKYDCFDLTLTHPDGTTKKIIQMGSFYRPLVPWMDHFKAILAREAASTAPIPVATVPDVPEAVAVPSAVVPPPAADTYDYVGQLRQIEHAYRDEEARRIGGAVEVSVDEGLIDILADDEVVEVKHGAAWKHALGQVLVYAGSRRFEGRTMRMRLHLFGIDGAMLTLCRRHCARFGVAVSVAVPATEVAVPA